MIRWLLDRFTDIGDFALRWRKDQDFPPVEQCPCCDYVTLSMRGIDAICPVCFWEDDGQDVDRLDARSGPNHGITLREGRECFLKHGACEIDMLKYVLSVEDRADFEYRPRQL